MQKEPREWQYIKTEDIQPNPIALRSYSVKSQQKRINKIAKFLQEGGQPPPIIVDKDLVIRDGYTRYLAAKKIGLKEIKAIIMSDEEWSAYIGLK